MNTSSQNRGLEKKSTGHGSGPGVLRDTQESVLGLAREAGVNADFLALCGQRLHCSIEVPGLADPIMVGVVSKMVSSEAPRQLGPSCCVPG